MNNTDFDNIVSEVKTSLDTSLNTENKNVLKNGKDSLLYVSLTKLLNFVQNPDKEALSLSLKNVHYKGVYSIPVRIGANNELGRFFFSTKKIPPMAVQFHSHKYDLNIIPLYGKIVHYRLYPADYPKSSSDCYCYDRYEYSSGLNGSGEMKCIDSYPYSMESNILPIGSFIKLEHSDIHTMSCSKGSVWYVEEVEYKSNKSYFLGLPFSTSKFYEKIEIEEAKNILENIELIILSLLENYKNEKCE